jgi:hypothetical protein
MMAIGTRVAGRRGEPGRGGALRRRVGVRFACFALLVVAGAASPPAVRAADETKTSPAPKTWHATVFFSSGSSYRIIHYWSDGAMMRAETLISGHPITTIVRGDRYVALDRLTGKALEIERSPAAVLADQGRTRPFGIELDDVKKAGGERIDDTTMSGVPVEVWRSTDDKSRRTVWVSKKPPHVPIRAETFVRGSSQTLTFDYSNWSFDLEVPAAFFALPSEVSVERYGYAEFGAKSVKDPIAGPPILYPDLLHGG